MKDTQYDIIGVQKDVLWGFKDFGGQKGIDELT